MTISESSRSLLVVLALGATGSSAASACPADPFAAFRADFNQANAAWARDGDNVHVADGQLVLKPDLNSGWRLPIPSFKLTAGAYCAEIKSPTGPNDAHAGIMLWMTDAANLLTATVAPDGTFQIRHKKENVWKTLLARTGPKLKTGPGAVNEIRVVTKKIVDVAAVGDTRFPIEYSILALYLNGGFVADMDMKAPKDGGSFGLYAQSARQQRSEWRVLSFSATPLPLEPSGRYKVTGTAGGSSYEGTVTVEETGDSYAVEWSIDKQSIKGTGVLRGATFSVAYRSAGKAELATYGPAGIDWSGKRTGSGAGAQAATETWLRQPRQ